MKPKPIFTESQLDFIKENYLLMSDRELALRTGISRCVIQSYRLKNNLLKTKPNRPNENKCLEMYFNVNERWNWAV